MCVLEDWRRTEHVFGLLYWGLRAVEVCAEVGHQLAVLTGL